MALKKPLVLNSGQIEQLQPGDTLDATVTNAITFSMTNDNAGAITIGQPVYVSGADSVDEAQANAESTATVIGLVLDASIAAAASGSIQSDGVLSSSDWTAVTGGTTLTAGSLYFLDEASPGSLTTTAPATGFVTEIGQAISTTDLEISIRRRIKL